MTTPDVYRDAEHIADVSGILYGGNDDEPVASINSREGRLKKTQAALKVSFIDRLLRDLDILIYCELSALYYLDCSIILFAIRGIVQMIFFSPKPAPFDPTRNQPFIGAIFACNLFCIAFHNFFSRPEAGEDTRGYVHGGLLIDFIGQKTPISLFRLLSLDILVMFLHFTMLGLIIERVRTNDSTATTSSTPAAQPSGPQQDHDSEERGVIRNTQTQSEEGIELDDLNPQNTDRASTEHERTEILSEPIEPPSSKDANSIDTFASGQAVIMHMGLFDVIRDQWRYSSSGAPAPRTSSSSSYVPSTETASFFRERFGLRIRPDGRFERVQ